MLHAAAAPARQFLEVVWLGCIRDLLIIFRASILQSPTG